MTLRIGPRTDRAVRSRALGATRPRAAVAAAIAALLGVLAACDQDQTTGDEEGASVGDIQEEDAAGPGSSPEGAPGEDSAYVGPYDGEFYDDFDSYEGERVTVSAEIQRILGPNAFTLAGDDVEELLVVSADEVSHLVVGSSVEVTGTVHAALDLPVIERRLEKELDDSSLEDWDQEPYLEASHVDPVLDEVPG